MTVPNPMDLAVCKDMPTALWFPVKVKGQDNHGSAAKDFCKQCPALVPCLEGALERNESEGIWGGAGGDEMRNLRRAWVKGRAIPEYWQQALLRHIARLDGDGELVDRNGPGATHGLRATYNRGCRCVPCRWAAADDVAEKAGRRSA